MAKKKSVQLESKTAIRNLDMIDLYKKVFESEDGQQVLHDLMKSTLFFQTTFDPNPSIHAYNEGKRSIVSDILHTLGKNPAELHKQMLKQQEIDKLYHS